MGAQATSFCALDTLAVPYLDRIRSSRQQKFRRGQKNFQEASVVLLSHCFYCYFSAIADRLGSLPRHYTSWSGVRFSWFVWSTLRGCDCQRSSINLCAASAGKVGRSANTIRRTASIGTTLLQHQTRDQCRSNVSPFKKPDTWVRTLLKRQATFLTKISCATARRRAPPEERSG
jgi:hypothetical protein